MSPQTRAKSLSLVGAFLLAVFVVHGQESHDDVLKKIRIEAQERSQVGALFDHFTTVIGPRLTATPAYRAAAEWSKARLTEWGLSNPRLDPFEFGRGWELEHFTLEMIEPRYMPLIGYAEGGPPRPRAKSSASRSSHSGGHMRAWRP